ncbi:MAG TPA: hypothetical protein VFH48_13135 [Chloroflexota bacterium]|nr:hypothetical protein [Chloroflexota bacterium]
MATSSLADARTRVVTPARGRASARWAGLGSSVAFCLAALLLLFGGGAPPRELRVEQMAASRAFPLVDWHLARIAERSQRIGLGLLGARPMPTETDRSAAAAYFATPSADRAPLAPGAETAIERAVSTVLRQEGLDDRPAPWTAEGEILFPPVSFAFTRPPEVLIVARRDRISVVQSELLRPGIADADAERLEADVDALGYSSLVTEIGGLATFPTMVVDTNRPLDALVAVTHEWIHGYLFFTPLGARYWTNQDARMINETVADMVSRELGPRVVRELGLESPPSSTARSATPQPSMVQFRAMMRETRVQLDALLREGKIDEAEAYLRDRRLEFVAAGFQIRKLNQAYFAFYGSYGDAAAGVSPIPRQLGWLRAESGSPGEFLHRVGELTSAEDLARAVGE